MRKLFAVAALTAAIMTTAPSGAIVGGRLASTGEYPWMAAIYTGSNPSSGQFCGGTLVAPDVVVSAKHCVNDLLDNLAAGLPDLVGLRMKVLLGQNKLNGTGGERITVRKITSHATVDVTVLELMSNSTKTPLGLIHPADAALVAPGTLATVTGWGATSEGGSGSNDLLEAEVPIMSDGTCATYYGTRTVASTEICAGYPDGGVDTCQGDSGGPMIVPKPSGGFLLAGATSWGDGCARPNAPGVYAEIAAAAAFIDPFLA